MALKLQTRYLYDITNGRHPEWPNGLDANTQLWAYNGLDSAVTLLVHHKLQEAIASRNDSSAQTSYRFVRAMQGPAMAMMLRGIAINQRVRQEEFARISEVRNRAQALLDRFADSVWGPEHYTQVVRRKEWHTPIGKKGLPLTPRQVTVRSEIPCTRPRGLNSNSPTQVLAFFNIALGFPVEYEIRKTPQGSIRTPSANDKVLRKWAKRRTKGPGIDPRNRDVPPVNLAAPFVSLILTLRDCDKMLAVLRTPLERDGRMRCSYNVVGTKWGRWSSSKNQFGRGSNLQNITPTMRRMFCSDDGWRMVSPDLEQAESRAVAGKVWEVTGDRTYLDACLSADLHTQVCKMAWPEREWTNDPTLDRRLAEEVYPNLGGLTYRDLSKRIGHGSNYWGSAFGISAAVGIPTYVVEEFQVRYFNAFKSIREWHRWVREQLMAFRYLDTPLGRRNHFLDRPTDDATVREAIAFVPQSTVAELLNLILYRVWERSILPPSNPRYLPIQVLLQNHDAFVFQTPETSDLPSTINEVNSEFQRAVVPFERGEETLPLSIPGEFLVGWNWAKTDPECRDFKDGNPDGLTKWRGSDLRTRAQGANVSPADWLGVGAPSIY